MSGELVHKLRVVRCPKCSLLLPEYPEYDVYKCGGCNTTLEAKKRKSVAVNSESSTQETDAAPRNALGVVSGDEQDSNTKQLAPPQEDGLKAKATSSSSGECYFDGNVGRGQNKNGECIGDQLQPFSLSDEELESEVDIYKLSLRRHRVSNRGSSNKTTCCEIEEINSGNLLSEGSKEVFSSASDENDNCDKSSLLGVMSEMEITGSESKVAEELNTGNLLVEGAEEELSSGSDGESANSYKSALVSAKPKVEINGSDFERAEELNNGNSLLEGAEEELICGSAGEDDNKVKSATTDVSPEVEIAGGGDFEGAEELNNENLLLEEAEEKLISGSDGEDANEDKSALGVANPKVEIAKSDLKGTEELDAENLLLKEPEDELVSELNEENVNNYKLTLVGEDLEVEVTGSNITGKELNSGKLLLEEEKEELNVCAPDGEDPNNDQSTKSEVDITESTSTAKTSSTEYFEFEKESISVTPDEVEEGTSGNPASSNELQKQAQKSIHHSFDVDTLNNRELIDHSSELSGNLEGFSKYPNTRSSYAYDGSLSSCDGIDERFPIRHLDSFENTYNFANRVSEGMTRKGKGLANSMSGDLGKQHQSYLPNGKHHSMKDGRGSQNKVLETTRHGHRHQIKMEREELPSRMPFHQSGFYSRYEGSSPPNQMRDELYRSSSFLSPDSSEDKYQQKMKLLRMIHKLQDQLNRTRYASVETNGRLSTGVSYKGNHISACHIHDLHEGRFAHGLDYRRCNGRCSHEVNLRRRHNFSRIPYSDEATSSAHHVDHSCSYCYPKARHFSTDVPPHSLFHHEELHRSYLDRDSFSYHHSYPSSPQWFSPSKLPLYGLETKSDDLKHRAHKVRRYLREKHHSAKRNYTPVAGGAPFVTCHKCLNLLQLPVDFFHSKKGRRQLKCGKCSEVLEFSLRNRSLVSYSPNALGPPPSDFSDQSEVINSSNVTSASHANYYHY